MTFKKAMSVMLGCAFVLGALSACSDTGAVSAEASVSASAPGSGSVSISASEHVTVPDAPAEEHVHAALEHWERDAWEHWKVCQCGEQMELAAHSLDEMGVCADCASEILDYGMIEVNNYNEYGDRIRSTLYEETGTVAGEVVNEFEYDAQGYMLRNTCYENGVLTVEDEYALDGDGAHYLKVSSSYQEDGGCFVNEYDPNGNVTAFLYREADGTVSSEAYYLYEQDRNGEYYEAEERGRYGETTYAYQYNEYEDLIYATEADLDGNVIQERRVERGYNEDGIQVWEKTYVNGRLIGEILGYAVYVKEDYYNRYPETMVEYYEDGTKLVSRYEGDGMLAVETTYAADGSVEKELRYVYEYDDQGNWSSIQVYDGQRLFRDTRYALDEDGWSYKASETEYREDGGRTVKEFNEYDELVSQTDYDAAGNKIGSCSGNKRIGNG